MPVMSYRPIFTWITLEASEVIELKEVMMDRDYQGTADFFWNIVVPRVQEAAQRRGIPLDLEDENNGHLPG